MDAPRGHAIDAETICPQRWVWPCRRWFSRPRSPRGAKQPRLVPRCGIDALSLRRSWGCYCILFKHESKTGWSVPGCVVSPMERKRCSTFGAMYLNGGWESSGSFIVSRYPAW